MKLWEWAAFVLICLVIFWLVVFVISPHISNP